MNKSKKIKFVVGIDEVGRGALAGPVVVVAAMTMGQGACAKCRDGTLKDSKKLSAKQREAWCAHFRNHPGMAFAVARVYPRQIEKRNISAAANLAALRAHKKLIANQRALSNWPVFLDGGLYLNSRQAQSIDFPNAKTLIKADENIATVAIASIIAKVNRDGYMRRLAKKYPKYGFEIHKGYGTKMHCATLKKWGHSRVHRLTFLKKQPTIGK